jgi:hypothetical protein
MTASRLGALILAIIAIAAMFMAFQMGIWSKGTPRPGLFPLLSSVLLFAMTVAGVLVRSASEDEGAPPVQHLRMVKYCAVIIGFLMAIEIVGTAIAAALFLFVVLKGIEDVSWKRATAVALGVAVVTVGLFEQFLGVPLPTGLWG